MGSDIETFLVFLKCFVNDFCPMFQYQALLQEYSVISPNQVLMHAVQEVAISGGTKSAQKGSFNPQSSVTVFRSFS